MNVGTLAEINGTSAGYIARTGHCACLGRSKISSRHVMFYRFDVQRRHNQSAADEKVPANRNVGVGDERAYFVGGQQGRSANEFHSLPKLSCGGLPTFLIRTLEGDQQWERVSSLMSIAVLQRSQLRA